MMDQFLPSEQFPYSSLFQLNIARAKPIRKSVILEDYFRPKVFQPTPLKFREMSASNPFAADPSRAMPSACTILWDLTGQWGLSLFDKLVVVHRHLGSCLRNPPNRRLFAYRRGFVIDFLVVSALIRLESSSVVTFGERFIEATATGKLLCASFHLLQP